jgi:hypothetical protein
MHNRAIKWFYLNTRGQKLLLTKDIFTRPQAAKQRSWGVLSSAGERDFSLL